MSQLPISFNTLRSLHNDKKRYYYSLPALEEKGVGKISRLPISIRIMLESLLRNCDGKQVKEEDVETLSQMESQKPYHERCSLYRLRGSFLQDFTGVPLLVDLAAMRDAVADKNKASETHRAPSSCRSRRRPFGASGSFGNGRCISSLT